MNLILSHLRREISFLEGGELVNRPCLSETVFFVPGFGRESN